MCYRITLQLLIRKTVELVLRNVMAEKYYAELVLLVKAQGIAYTRRKWKNAYRAIHVANLKSFYDIG